MLLRAGEILALDDVRGILPDGLHVALFNQVALEGVVGAPDDSGLPLAFFHGVHGRERLVLDRNRINGLTKHATVCMRQKQNRLFGMIHCFGGQARLVVQDQGDAVFPRNVFGCYQDKLVPRNARIKANLSDLSPRYVATYGCAVKHAGQNHVVDVACRSGDFVPAFLARH